MAEVHRLTSQTIYLDIHGGEADDNAVAAVLQSGDTARTLTVTQESDDADVQGRYSVTLNMADTQEEGDLVLHWSFEMGGAQVRKTDYISVVTPYLSMDELRKVWDDGTNDELREVEAAARHIINSYTGQSFGLRKTTHTIKGTGLTYLPLPERLLSLDGVEGYRYGNVLTVAAGGWYLSAGPAPFVPPIKADLDGFNSGSHLEVPIRVPAFMRNTGNTFYLNEQYTVSGTWGWNYVPQEVKEAAKLLVNDYACGDNLYRDRFLTSMTAADWRIQFHDGAFEGTGNVRADQLLNGFVLSRGWAVI
jgi:hypothetical protein